MSGTTAEALDATVAALARAQRDDGGWGAEPGKRSNTEATALAVTALAERRNPEHAGRAKAGLAWLASRQKDDGSWTLSAEMTDSSWTTSLAVLALLGLDAERDRARRGLLWLVSQSGRDPGWLVSLLYRFRPQALPVRMDPHLKGWAWASGAFSWVEPTAYALLALKKGRHLLSGPEVTERVQQGERMIYDRMCDGGGWNYGNSAVFGVNVPPYPEVTALALIALQDRRPEGPNRQSLGALRRMLAETESGFALSWAVLCLAIHGEDTGPLVSRLARSAERTGFLSATRTMALAALATSGGAGFRL